MAKTILPVGVSITPLYVDDMQYCIKNIQYVPERITMEFWTSDEKYCSVVESHSTNPGSWVMREDTETLYRTTDTEDNDVDFSALKDGVYVVVKESIPIATRMLK